MLERVNSDLNIDVAIIYASNKVERTEQDNNYTEMFNDEEYILVTDPIRRIADMKY